MPNSPMGGTVRRMDGAEQVLSEVLAATRRPDGYAVMTLDVQAADDFRKARAAETGVQLTLIDLFLKAFALAFGKDPHTNALVRGHTIQSWDTADIGLSVAAGTALAPIVVIRSVEKKSLEEIHAERVKLVREAVEGDAERRAKLARQAKWIPIPELRRRVVGFTVNRLDVRREFTGTMQLTSIDLPDMDFYLPTHVSSALLLSIGGVKPMAFVVDGVVQARLGVQVAFMIDQRVVHPVRAMRLFRRFRRYMENPEKLA